MRTLTSVRADDDVKAQKKKMDENKQKESRRALFNLTLSSHHFFLLATVLALPLRVRALVLVRWPRVGKLLMWRRPR